MNNVLKEKDYIEMDPDCVVVHPCVMPPTSAIVHAGVGEDAWRATCPELAIDATYNASGVESC